MIKFSHQFIHFFTLIIALMVVTGCRDISSEVVDAPVEPGIELLLSAPSLAASSSFEDSISRAAIFIYRQNDLSNAGPAFKYILTKQDINQGKAVIPMQTDFLAGHMVEIFVIVNSRDPNVNSDNKSLTRRELSALIDSNAVNRYNNWFYNDLPQGIVSGGGFTMAGYTALEIEKTSGKVQRIPITICRTTARIDVNVKTDTSAFTQYVTNLGYPNARIKILSATLLRTNRRVPLFDTRSTVTDDYLAPYTSYDSIAQNNDKYSPLAHFVGGFRFYTFETFARGAISYPFGGEEGDRNNRALKLLIKAEYDSDGNSGTPNSETIFYSLPVQAGGDPLNAGAIVRNGAYQIDVRVMGIGGVTKLVEYAPSRSEEGSSMLYYKVGGGQL